MRWVIKRNVSASPYLCDIDEWADVSWTKHRREATSFDSVQAAQEAATNAWGVGVFVRVVRVVKKARKKNAGEASSISWKDILRLRKDADEATTAYNTCSRKFQNECSHPEVLYHGDTKLFFDGYSHSGPQEWFCTRCKLSHYTSDRYSDHVLRHKPYRTVSREEFDKAQAW